MALSRTLLAATLILALLGVGCLESPRHHLSNSELAALEPLVTTAADHLEIPVQVQLEAARTDLDQILAKPEITADELTDAFANLGRLYHAYELFADAEPCYANAARLQPKDYRWPYYLGMLNQKIGRLEEASTQFHIALELEPENVPCLLAMGLTEQELGRIDEAETHYQAALEVDGACAAAVLRLAQVATMRGDFTNAAKLYRRVLGLQPEATNTHRALAAIYRRLGDEKKALRHHRLAGEGLVAMADPLMAMLSEAVISSSALLNQGAIAFERGQLDEARILFSKAVALSPNDATAHLNLGSTLHLLGENDAALHELETAIRLAPSDARARFNLGTLLAAEGLDDQAIAGFEAALQIDPGHRDAHFNMANALYRQNRFGGASDHFHKVVELEPGDARARLGEARSLIRNGRDREALIRLEQGVSGLPGDRALVNTLARLLACSPDPVVRDPERALELAGSLIATNSELEHIRTVAMAHASLGQWHDALAVQQAAVAAVEQSGKRPDLLDTLRSDLVDYQQQRPCRRAW